MKYRVFLFLAACALIVIYLPYLNEDFFLIDDASLVSIPQFQACSLKNFYHGFLLPGYHVDYYPVRELSYMFDRCLVGLNYFGLSGAWYRIHNLILFFGSVFFIFEILKKIKIQENFAFYSMLLVLWNPFFNESYLWISARKDVLAVFFMSMSAFLFLKGMESRRNKFFIFSLILFFLSLLSKATFVLLPLAFLVLFHLHKNKQERGYTLIASFVGLSWALFQSYFYSQYNNMSLNYPLLYKLKAASVSLFKICMGLFWDSFNLIDVCNWGEWVEIHESYILPGIAIFLLVGFFVLREVKNKRHSHFFVFLFALVLWIPISGLFFNHRNFYSTRYYLPIMIWLVPLSFLFTISKISSYRLKVFLTLGLTLFFLIQSFWSSHKKWSSNKNLIAFSFNQAPQNLANQTFYIQELLNQKGWGQLNQAELLNLDSNIQSLYEKCFLETRKTTFSLCSIAMPVLLNEQVFSLIQNPKNKKTLLMDYIYFLKNFVKKNTPSSVERVTFNSEIVLFLSGSFEKKDINIDLIPKGHFVSVENRLNYWAALCGLKRLNQANVFLKNMIEKNLIYELELKDVISQLKNEQTRRMASDCYKKYKNQKMSFNN